MLRIKLLVLGMLLATTAYLVPSASAALLTVTNEGEVRVNVLAETVALGIPRPAEIEVKNVATEGRATGDTTVSLSSESGKPTLLVSSGGRTREVDVSGVTQDIIEIEKVATPQTVKVFLKEGGFVIEERGVNAKTSYPIQVNAAKKELSVKSPSGERFLAVLPYEAMENSVKANVINVLPGEITLEENQEGELAYTVTGERKVELTRLVKFTVPVSTQVSASNGQILTVDQPLWFAVIDFLFV